MKYLIKKVRLTRKKPITEGLLKKCLLLILVFIGANAFSQQATFSLNLKDTTVEAVFEIIQKQSDLDFFYNNEEISKLNKVTIIGESLSLKEILDICFSGTHLKFSVVNNTIVVSVKNNENLEPSGPPTMLKQNIRGTVIDEDSEFTLPGANVVVISTNPMLGATTNPNGEFEIKGVPVGRHTLKISYMGYENALVSQILVGSAKEVVINVKLNEAVKSLNEITVQTEKGKALNQMATVSARSFSNEEAGRYAASINDPARMALVYAGVTSGDDFSNEIIIRGNSPSWMQWRLEGIEIPSPNHFAEEGLSSGAVNILSANMIAKSDFYTGAFPAEYGNALSGVFDINFRKGNTEKQEFILQAGILGFDFAAEGPFSKSYNGSYLVNYRYSTLSVLNQLGFKFDGGSFPNYQDLAFKFHLPTKKLGTFSLWGIGGISDVKYEYYPDSAYNEDYTYGTKGITETGMYATGISNTYFLNQDSYLKTMVSASESFSSEDRKQMDRDLTFIDEYYDDLKKRNTRANVIYNQKVSNRFTYRLGANITHMNYDYLSQDIDTLGTVKDAFKDKGNTNIYESFLQTKTKINNKLSFTAGLHFSHFALSSDNSFEPRLGLSWKLPKNQQINLGFGMHSKNESLPIYFITVDLPNGSLYQPNRNLKMTRSTHYVLSYEKRIKPNLNFKGEAYYQSISKMPVPINPNNTYTPVYGWPNNDDTLANIGLGRNYGLEITLEKYFADQYYVLFTSSLFNSEYKPANGDWLNSKFNTHYTFNLVSGKEFTLSKNKMLSLNSKLLWSGGKRGTPIDFEASRIADEVIYIEDKRYSLKADDYFRLDIGASMHFFRLRVEHVISFAIQNVTNRINKAGYIWYDIENEEVIESEMIGILPIVNYRLEF